MSKLKISPVEPEQLTEPQQLPEPPQIPEIMPEPVELTPDDGQTITPEMSEQIATESRADSLPVGLATTTTSNYTPDEFRAKFAGLLEFLENPATATNCAQELITNGRNLTADKIYNLATRYKWLNWIIDRKTQCFADSLQIGAFLAVETNLIVMNWTGLNIFERAKLWLQQKAAQLRQNKKDGNKRKTLFGWAFSGRAEAARPTEPSN